jgi:hypothetical protein
MTVKAIEIVFDLRYWVRNNATRTLEFLAQMSGWLTCTSTATAQRFTAKARKPTAKTRRFAAKARKPTAKTRTSTATARKFAAKIRKSTATVRDFTAKVVGLKTLKMPLFSGF